MGSSSKDSRGEVRDAWDLDIIIQWNDLNSLSDLCVLYRSGGCKAISAISLMFLKGR